MKKIPFHVMEEVYMGVGSRHFYQGNTEEKKEYWIIDRHNFQGLFRITKSMSYTLPKKKSKVYDGWEPMK